GDGDVVEEDAAVRRAADRRPVVLRHEALARTAAARADDERRAFNPEVVEGAQRLVSLGRAEGLRRLVALLAHEELAAFGAVVRGLRVLEAAFRTVDVAHTAG